MTGFDQWLVEFRSKSREGDGAFIAFVIGLCVACFVVGFIIGGR
jgi:hypothetical protein